MFVEKVSKFFLYVAFIGFFFMDGNCVASVNQLLGSRGDAIDYATEVKLDMDGNCVASVNQLLGSRGDAIDYATEVKLDASFNPLLGSRDDVVDYATKVKLGVLEETAMMTPISSIDVSLLSAPESQITSMRNLALASYYVPSERTDFQSLCMSKMVQLAGTIDCAGTVNYKILFLLFNSQIEEDSASSTYKLRKDVSVEIIEDMIGRFEALVNGDATAASDMKIKFYELLKKDSRFAAYCIGR